MELYRAAAVLRRGGVGVVPTDTLYGVLGCALSQRTVECLYRIKGRSPKKPFIILLSSIRELGRFGIYPSASERRVLDCLWPGKVSVIVRCKDARFRYLHRGTRTLALRVPKKKTLIALLKRTGPLVAPSANKEGKRPARTIREARNYFGESVDFYLPGGKLVGKPSTLIMMRNGTIRMLRRGADARRIKINLLRK